MMILYERQQQQQPHTSPHNPPLPFAATFPLNPRPFLTHPTPSTGPESSLILSFSDGLILPFLPSHLPLEGRFKLLARQAHRQLRVYQKRKRGAQQEVEIVSRAAGQMLPQLYLYTVQGEERKRKQKQKQKLREGGSGSGSGLDVQREHPVPTAASSAITATTCGVSSIGDRTALITPLAHSHKRSDSDSDNDTPSTRGQGRMEKEHDEAAVFDFVDIRLTVRARDGEFLVGSAGGEKGTGFNVSFDGCAINAGRVEREWKGLVEGLFEEEEDDAECSTGPERAKL